ncbi:MAG: type II toxin-antitoxin system VapC family toxin [Pirellulales bacterium]|nr:type II toxin-antitoxin system VapC family toxin [Pirellulales bacterium]
MLRIFDQSDSEHSTILKLLKSLRRDGQNLTTCPQNIAEFWNVSTRPSSSRGGYGQSAISTERRVRYIERLGAILLETPAVYHAWRKLAEELGLIGVAVHDARIVAMMKVAGIKTIITLNTKDFARYPDIEALTPQELLEQILDSGARKPSAE